MGGAKMHTTVSGVGHLLVKTEDEALDAGRRYLS
jgi:acetyl-CoA carboxylase carboxyltransferase component